VLRQRRLASSPWLRELLGGFDVFQKLERLLDQADLDTSVAKLLVMMLALGGAGLLAAPLLRSPALAVVLAPLLAASPILFAVNARAARSKKISEQLPDTLEMMARAIKAGHALPSSFKLVAQECPPPVAVEFAKAYEQQNLGLSLEAAVQSITERVPANLDLKIFAVSIKIQKETGGNLVEVLENIAEVMRERFKFYSKLRALTAEGRVSGVILGGLPIVVAFLIWVTNPDYLTELGHGLGRYILVGGFVLWCLGIVWIRALMKVVY
jgi:tight adherence protein B